MTHTALVGRRIAFLRQASGVTIMVRPGDPDPQQPKQKAPLNLYHFALQIRPKMRRYFPRRRDKTFAGRSEEVVA